MWGRWEYSVTEASRGYWRVQGYNTPPIGSEALREWEGA
jgi:hypothetical protein